VRLALEEDIGPGDITSQLVVPADHLSRAEVIAKQDFLVLSGVEPAALAFRLVDPEVKQEWRRAEGDLVTRGEVVCELAGRARSLLASERVALNFLQRLSGIATLTRRFVEAIKPYKVRILDTRKTTPGLRALEKAAVRAGGGSNHRFGLYDAILIKDNHLAVGGIASGGIARAVSLARQGRGAEAVKVEVEVTDLAGLEEALAAGPDIIMLDNMSVDMTAEAVRRVGGRISLEASGGIKLTNVVEVAATGVDYISVGALTHSAPAVDLSLEFLV